MTPHPAPEPGDTPTLTMSDAELAEFMGMSLEDYQQLGEDIRTGKVKLDTSWIE